MRQWRGPTDRNLPSPSLYRSDRRLQKLFDELDQTAQVETRRYGRSDITLLGWRRSPAAPIFVLPLGLKARIDSNNREFIILESGVTA